MGLLLLAVHLARPEMLHRLVHADTQLLRFLPWVPARVLEPESGYQQAYRQLAIIAVAGWTVLNLVLFLVAYFIPGAI